MTCNCPCDCENEARWNVRRQFFEHEPVRKPASMNLTVCNRCLFENDADREPISDEVMA